MLGLGQTSAVRLDAQQTQAFLDEQVDVYSQTVLQRVAKAVCVTHKKVGSMSRLVFMKMITAWFVIAVMGISLGTLRAGEVPSDSILEMALQYMPATADEFNSLYYEYVFDGTSKDLGFYTKDIKIQVNIDNRTK